MHENSQTAIWSLEVKNLRVSDHIQNSSETSGEEECLSSDLLEAYCKNLGTYKKRKRHRCLSSELPKIMPS